MKALGIQPSEFWTMKPRHFWMLYKAERGLHKSDRLSVNEVERLQRWMERVNDAAEDASQDRG